MTRNLRETGPHTRPIEEGIYPPVATASEIRELLNTCWRALFPDPNLANPEESEEIAVRLLLARAEIEFRRTVQLDATESRVIQDEVRIPAEYLQVIMDLRRNEASLDAQLRERDQVLELAQAKLAEIAEMCNTPPSGEDELAIRIQEVLEGGQARAAEYVARIERAAYEHGKEDARERYTAQYRNTTNNKLRAKLEKIARFVDDPTEAIGAATRAEIREVLDA